MERTIGDVVRDLRVAGGWHQKAAAFEAGFSPQYWGDIERGRRIPPPETVERIAAFFKVEPAALMWTWLRQQVGDEIADAMWRWPLGNGVTPDVTPVRDGQGE